MSFLVKAIPALLGIGGAAVSAAGGSNKSTQTSTGSTTGVLTPNQQGTDDMIAQMLHRFLRKGPEILKGERNQLYGQINTTYDSLGNRIESNLASRGFGESGKLGSGYRDLEISRANQMQKGEADLQQAAMTRFLQTLGLAQNYARPYSSTSTGTTTATGGPNPVFGAIGQGLGQLGTALWLKKLLGSKGSTASPSSGEPSDIDLYG